MEFEFEVGNWDVYVCSMIICEIDDTEGNANSKTMGNGRHIHPTVNSIEKGQKVYK